MIGVDEAGRGPFAGATCGRETETDGQADLVALILNTPLHELLSVIPGPSRVY